MGWTIPQVYVVVKWVEVKGGLGITITCCLAANLLLVLCTISFHASVVHEALTAIFPTSCRSDVTTLNPTLS